ncbi:hypothetical protein C6Y40_23785 [Alteromonas alba]|uniref:Nucleotidyltransferase family protein n=1 Tax=Alteromonas alba TaxID=2079529 RepID=A0A2S9V3P4_9ALTE|nr:nucleotidyltransferase family protein [Alteromonas alba]PRO71079.1 hypothetical protein C6Y40_23785 [Alteromonas alba]
MEKEERVRRLLVLNEVKKVCTYLDLKGIKFLVIKGLPFSKIIYNDELDRKFCDIDIFISNRDLEKTKTALEKLSYSNIRGWVPREISKQVTYRKKIHSVNVDIDLHYELTQFRTINRVFTFDSLFQRSIEFEIDDVTTQTFCHEDSYIFSKYHLQLEIYRGNKETKKWEEDVQKLSKHINTDKIKYEKSFINFIKKLKKNDSKYSTLKYFYLRFKESDNKLIFIKETIIPPKQELKYTNKYRSRLHRILFIRK